jgi:hypothetical protein
LTESSGCDGNSAGDKSSRRRIGLDQQGQVARRLVHVQAEGMGNVDVEHRCAWTTGIKRAIVPDAAG